MGFEEMLKFHQIINDVDWKKCDPIFVYALACSLSEGRDEINSL
jgi:hypothetical protein